jgi:cell division protein FtsB
MKELYSSDQQARLLPRTAEIRKRLPQAVIGLAVVCVIGYFVYHVIHGDRGLVAWQMLDKDVIDAEAELAAVRSERIALERRVGLLRLESLDLDMLDEWSRRILNYGAADEAVIFTDEGDDLPAEPPPSGISPQAGRDGRLLGGEP